MTRERTLTARELDVLNLMTEHTDREIAAILRISPRTASGYVAIVLQKLDARTRTEAVVIGIRSGLVDTFDPARARQGAGPA